MARRRQVEIVHAPNRWPWTGSQREALSIQNGKPAFTLCGAAGRVNPYRTDLVDCKACWAVLSQLEEAKSTAAPASGGAG